MLRNGWSLLSHGGSKRSVQRTLARPRVRYASTPSQKGDGQTEWSIVMARQVQVVSRQAEVQTRNRAGQVRLGVWIEFISLFWMVIEASIAITAGFAAHSVSLEGFGIDSIIELIAGGFLLWRLLVEQR